MRSGRLAAGLAIVISGSLAGVGVTTPAFAAPDDLVVVQPPETLGDNGDPYGFSMVVDGLSGAGALSVSLDIGGGDPENWLFDYESAPDIWTPIDIPAGADIAVANGDTVNFRLATSNLGHGDLEPGANDICPIDFGPLGTVLEATLFDGDEVLDTEQFSIEIVHLSGGMEGLDTGEFGEGSGEPVPSELVKGDPPTRFSMTVCNYSQSAYTDLALVPHISAGTDEAFGPGDVTLEVLDPTTGEWEPVELTVDAGGNNLDGPGLLFDLGPFEDGVVDLRIAFAGSTTATLALVQFLLVTQDDVAQFNRESVVRILDAAPSDPTTTPTPSTTPPSAAPTSGEKGSPEKGSSLPETGGGNGTGVLVAVATVLLMSGAALVVTSRRRSSKES